MCTGLPVRQPSKQILMDPERRWAVLPTPMSDRKKWNCAEKSHEGTLRRLSCFVVLMCGDYMASLAVCNEDIIIEADEATRL